MRIFFIVMLLLCVSIISKGQNQDLKIDFSYNKQSNSLLLNLCNSTDKEIIVRNQYMIELKGSCIRLNQEENGRRTFFTINLFRWENGKSVPIKKITPKGKMKLVYPFDKIPANNVVKAELQILTFVKDEKTNKLITKTYTKEVDTTR